MSEEEYDCYEDDFSVELTEKKLAEIVKESGDNPLDFIENAVREKLRDDFPESDTIVGDKINKYLTYYFACRRQDEIDEKKNERKLRKYKTDKVVREINGKSCDDILNFHRKICVHEKIRKKCSLCRGRGTCAHGRRKKNCCACGGSNICSHFIPKHECWRCNSKRQCSVELCNKILYAGGGSRCLSCQVAESPASVIANYNTKEMHIFVEIFKVFPEEDWIVDRAIQSGSSERRPDMLLDLSDKVLIVEIDENRHSGYDEENEKVRLSQISRDLLFKKCVVIRFNPDGYGDGATKVKSCFTKKEGNLKIRDAKMFNDRVKKLAEEIKFWIKKDASDRIKVIKLFY